MFYKAFDPWAANADWYLTVPAGEEVRLGTGTRAFLRDRLRAYPRRCA